MEPASSANLVTILREDDREQRRLFSRFCLLLSLCVAFWLLSERGLSPQLTATYVSTLVFASLLVGAFGLRAPPLLLFLGVFAILSLALTFGVFVAGSGSAAAFAFGSVQLVRGLQARSWLTSQHAVHSE